MWLTRHAPKNAVYSLLWASEMQTVWVFPAVCLQICFVLVFLMICSVNYLAHVHLFVQTGPCVCRDQGVLPAFWGGNGKYSTEFRNFYHSQRRCVMVHYKDRFMSTWK